MCVVYPRQRDNSKLEQLDCLDLLSRLQALPSFCDDPECNIKALSGRAMMSGKRDLQRRLILNSTRFVRSKWEASSCVMHHC